MGARAGSADGGAHKRDRTRREPTPQPSPPDPSPARSLALPRRRGREGWGQSGGGLGRGWPAVLAAVSGSVMVGFMPWIARHLYADGLSAPSMLFWRYVLALAALIIAARAI